MAKVNWYTTCPKCNTRYHCSHSCCPECELEQYWRDLAVYYQREAQNCLKTAEEIARSKVKASPALEGVL